MSIRLYPPDANQPGSGYATQKANGAYDHSGNNGICVLSPISCSIAEIAGGEYTLQLVHPYDPQGKWRMIAEDYIICAPVPAIYVPQVSIGGLEKFQVYSYYGHTSAKLYSNVRTAAKQENAIYKMKEDTLGEMAWSKKKKYKEGDYVTYGTGPIKVYRAIEDPEKGDDPEGTYDDPDDNPWEFQKNLSEYINPPDDATEIATIPEDEVFYKIADFDIGYMYVYRQNGQCGFVMTADCESIGSYSGTRVVEPTAITEQDFRIYKVVYDDDAQTVTVEAQHISYDLKRNALYHCEVNDQAPNTAIVQILGKTADNTQSYDVICDIQDAETDEDYGVNIDADWSWNNPVMALLDPGEGMAGITKARVIRDNNVFYLLKDTENDHGFEIRYGGNLLGVTLTRDCDEVITRVIPYADDGMNGRLFHDPPYRNSSVIGDYPFPRVEFLESEYRVGEEIELPNGKTKKLTESAVSNKMWAEAKKRFTVDKVDQEKVEIDIDFLMLGDTVEYQQYKDLQTLSLYDTVKVITGPSDMVLFGQVSEYEYDAINRRFARISIGTIYKQERGKIGSFRLAKGGVNYSSLAPALKKKIKGAT